LLQGVQQAGNMTETGAMPQGQMPQQTDASRMPQGNVQQPYKSTYNRGETLKKIYAMGGTFPEAMRGEQAAQKADQQAKFHADKMALTKEMAERKLGFTASEADKKLRFSDTKKLRESIDDAAKNARTDLKNSKLQMDIAKSGKLIGPKENALLEWVGEKMGMNSNQIDAFRNGESQVFQKLSIPYFRNMKPSFGSKPTQWEAQQLQKGFASLYQTPEGREIIIRLTMAEAKSNLMSQKIKDEIIRENKGIPPLNLNEQINNKLDLWQGKQFVEMRNKISDIFARDAELDNTSAAKAGKGSSITLDNGVIMISNGKKWEMANSDNLGV
jgi:hypothetical protein